MGRRATYYAPRTIEMERQPNGSFLPNVQAAPSAPIEAYRPPVDPATLNQIPAAPPVHDQGSRGMTDADIRDFGTDSQGRPVVTRNPVTGKAEFNPEIDYEGRPFNQPPDSTFDGTRSRTGREALGELAEGAGKIADFLGVVEGTGQIADVLTDVTGLDDLAAWAGRGLFELEGDVFARFGLAHPTHGQPTGNITVYGPSAFSGGQCPTTYRVFGLMSTTSRGRPAFTDRYTEGPRLYNGPIAAVYITENRKAIVVRSANGQEADLFRTPSSRIVITDFKLQNPVRADGLPDTCGDPLGAPVDTPTAAPTKPRFDYPEPHRHPDARNPNAPTGPGLDPNRPNGEPEIPSAPGAEGDDLPDPLDGVPEDPGAQDEPDTPTKKRDCCEDSSLKLDEVLRKLAGEGKGTIDVTPCDYEEPVIDAGQSGLEQPEVDPVKIDYGGMGLAGIYDAIAALTQSLNFIAGNTKCPPETTAALPMFWEVKSPEVAQLVVAWRKVDGGNSKWSMTIPHPRADIDSRYPFTFPIYKKGGNMASARLTDNSKIIINAFSEAEAQRILDYIETLIDEAYIPPEGLRMIYSSNVAEYVEADVRAEYVKKFSGHKTTAPLWGVHLPSA